MRLLIGRVGLRITFQLQFTYTIYDRSLHLYIYIGPLRSRTYQRRGGAPIGAGGGHDPPLFEAKGDGGIIWE